MAIIDVGVRLSYNDVGEGGRTAVLLHALGEHAGDWDQVVPVLLPTHRVLALDQRGHGRSERPGEYRLEQLRDDVVAFLDRLDLREVDLIGHSMGAVVAYLVAETGCDRLARLVLEDPAPPLPSDPPRQPGPEPAEDPGFDWAVVTSTAKERNAPDQRWWDDLPLIRVPTLIIAGGPASHLPQHQQAAMARRIPRAELVTIPVGHEVHSTAPDRFNAVLTAYLARSAPTA